MNELEVTGKARWTQLHQDKSNLLTRCTEYARLTLPYLCPPSGAKATELQGPKASIGAAGVNNLANKLIMTLFQPAQPFFRLTVSMDTVNELKDAAAAGDQDAVQALAEIDQRLAAKEKAAMVELDYNRFRTEATTAAKHLIVTGNALMYHPPGNKNGINKTQTYGINNYCVSRDLSGNVLEFITLDQKAISTFSMEVQAKLKESIAKLPKEQQAKANVDLYTWVVLAEDGRYTMTQYANDIKLDSTGSWPRDELPWLILTWNLLRGEDYGRGLVEDYAGAFNALDVLTEAYLTIVAISADIKFLVAPTSVTDPVQFNAARSGAYLAGMKDDVTTVQIDKAQDVNTVLTAIQDYKQEIGRAFLLNSAVRRDAERVTAEEIRADINELDMSHGGVYSRFAEDWQLHLAILTLKRVGLEMGKNKEIYPQIITGLDSLSRAGDLDNLRMFVADLAMLDGIPEDIRRVIDPGKFVEFIGIRRGVEYDKFLKSQDQMIAEQDAAKQQEADMMAQQAGANMATAAGKQAMQGEMQ